MFGMGWDRKLLSNKPRAFKLIQSMRLSLQYQSRGKILMLVYIMLEYKEENSKNCYD